MRDDQSEGDQPKEVQPEGDPTDDDLRPGQRSFVAAAAKAGTLLRYELLARGRRVRITLKDGRYSDAATRDAYIGALWDEMVEDEELEIVPARTVAGRIAELVNVVRAEHPEHLPNPHKPDRAVEKDREVVKKILQRLGKIPG